MSKCRIQIGIWFTFASEPNNDDLAAPINCPPSCLGCPFLRTGGCEFLCSLGSVIPVMTPNEIASSESSVECPKPSAVAVSVTLRP